MVCPSLAHRDLLQQIQQGDWTQAKNPGGKLRGKEKGECFLHLGNGFFSAKRVRGPCKWRRVARIVHSKEALVWYYSCHCTTFNDAHLPLSLSLSLQIFSAIAQKDVCSDHQQRKKDGQGGRIRHEFLETKWPSAHRNWSAHSQSGGKTQFARGTTLIIHQTMTGSSREFRVLENDATNLVCCWRARSYHCPLLCEQRGGERRQAFVLSLFPLARQRLFVLSLLQDIVVVLRCHFLLHLFPSCCAFC